MWLKLLVQHYMFVALMPPTWGHIPAYITTPASKVDQICSLAETCVHDTIPICGRNMGGGELKTFLDICDLLEYTCDTGEIYNHIDDSPGCPKRPVKPPEE